MDTLVYRIGDAFDGWVLRNAVDPTIDEGTDGIKWVAAILVLLARTGIRGLGGGLLG